MRHPCASGLSHPLERLHSLARYAHDSRDARQPTGAGRVEFMDCKIGSREIEMDKIVESVLFERCDLRAWRAAARGVLNVRFIDCNIYGFMQGTPRLVDHGRVPFL